MMNNYIKVNKYPKKSKMNNRKRKINQSKFIEHKKLKIKSIKNYKIKLYNKSMNCLAKKFLNKQYKIEKKIEQRKNKNKAENHSSLKQKKVYFNGLSNKEPEKIRILKVKQKN